MEAFLSTETIALVLIVSAFHMILFAVVNRWRSKRMGIGKNENSDNNQTFYPDRFPAEMESVEEYLDLNLVHPPKTPTPVSVSSTMEEDGRYEEQERWNLPGFLSIPAPKVDLSGAMNTGVFEKDPMNLPVKSSLFDHTFYSFYDFPRDPSVMLDLESFSRRFLKELEELYHDSVNTLYLKNHKGNPEAVLQLRGNTFVYGDGMENVSFEDDVRERIMAGNMAIVDNGYTAHFPMITPGGIVGMVRIRNKHSLFDRERLNHIYRKINKFSTFLYQSRIFESASTDPDSSLENGILFHRELLRIFIRQEQYAVYPMLLLIQLKSNHTMSRSDINYFGAALRLLFGEQYTAYRIALDVCAVLGPEISSEELGDAMERLRESLKEISADFYSGAAVLNESYGEARQWFDRASRALQESTISPEKSSTVVSDRDQTIQRA